MVFRQLASRYPAQQLRREMDRLLSDFLGAPGETPWGGAGMNRPPVNLWETADALTLEMEVPGVKSQQIEISVVGNQLSVKIERPDVSQQGVAFHRRERAVGTFSRALQLPVDVDAERVQADLRNGVLTVTLPKAAAARPRKIQVTTAQ